MKKLRIRASSSLTFEEGCNLYLDDCRRRNCKNRRHYATCTDEIGHLHGAVGQSTLRQKLHGKI